MDASERTNHKRTVYIRVIFSIGLYISFFIVSIFTILTQRTNTGWPILYLMLLVGSFLMMPSKTLPRHWSPDGSDEQNEFSLYLNSIQTWSTYTKMAFFFFALLTLFGLPKIVN